MINLYYDFEQDEFITSRDVYMEWKNHYDSGETDQSYSVYLCHCMYWNNGSLYPLDYYEQKLKKALEKLDVCEENIDEIRGLTEELYRLYEFRSDNIAPVLFLDEIAEALRDFQPGTEIRLYLGTVWKHSRFVPEKYDSALCRELYDLSEAGYSIRIGQVELTKDYEWRK